MLATAMTTTERPIGKALVPANKRAFSALLVGGFGKLRNQIYDKMLELYGISLDHHWAMERKRSDRGDLPVGTELILTMQGMLPPGWGQAAVDLAKRHRVPHVSIRRSPGSWMQPLYLAGFHTPPPWRKPEAFAVPAALERARRVTQEITIEESKIAPIAPIVTSEPRNVSRSEWGTALMQARKEANLTRQELATLIGVSDGAIVNYEHGDNGPNLINYEKILDLLPSLRAIRPPLSTRKPPQLAVVRSSAPAPAPEPEIVDVPAPVAVEAHPVDPPGSMVEIPTPAEVIAHVAHLSAAELATRYAAAVVECERLAALEAKIRAERADALELVHKLHADLSAMLAKP